jgi:uncharacterized protein (DUF2062 family)
MPKKFIQRWLPDPRRLRARRSLRLFGRWLDHANLWALNRRSASGACAVGLFWAFIPSPTQMLPAAACAIALRVNLPLSVALVWVANPFTMPPMFYFNYRLGAWLLGAPARPFVFEPSWAWLMQELGAIWPPLLLGSVMAATVAALAGYAGMQAFWRRRMRRARARTAGASGRRFRRP